MALTEETRAAAQEIIARYPEGRSRSALLPMLHLVQAEEGYVTPAGIALCAEVLGLTKAEVGAVATFYTMYKRRPTGEYLVSVCTNLSCQILGGEEIYARLSRRLGVGHDETTADGVVTLEHAECLAACDYAPVVTVNYEFFDNQTPETAEELIDALHRGERPLPTRGAQVCSFREISRQLAGFRDPRPAAVAAGLAHPDAPPPTDSTGTESLAGTDIAPPAEAGTFGTPGGVTERVLSDADAAATYGEPGTASAGPAVGTAGADPADVPAKQATHGDVPTGQEAAGADGSSDGSSSDGSVSDGSVSDGSFSDGSSSDGTAPLDDAATDPNLRPVRADESDQSPPTKTPHEGRRRPLRRKTSPTDRER